jgi:hypothetical protein
MELLINQTLILEINPASRDSAALCAVSRQVIPLIGDFQNISLKSEAWDDSTGCDPRRNVLPLLGDVRYLEIPVDLLLVRKPWSGEQELRKAGGPRYQC